MISTVRKGSTQSSTSTSYADVADLSFAVAAYTAYAFSFSVHVTTGASDAIWLAVNGPASPLKLAVGGNVSRLQINGIANGSVAAYDTAVVASTATEATSRLARIEGFIFTGANSGTLTLRVRSETGASVSVLADSTGTITDGVTSVSVALTGVAGTSSRGTSAPAVGIGITGNGATGGAGTVTAPSSGSAALTGVSGTAAAGTSAPGLTAGPTGVAVAGSTGTVTASRSLGITGGTATAAVGAVAVAIALALTGVATSSAVGTTGVARSKALTGNGATGSAGSVTASGGAGSGAALTGAITLQTVMPLGDSLTEGYPDDLGGWREPFFTAFPGLLSQGSLTIGSTGTPARALNHEGHSGQTSAVIDASITTYYTATPSQYVLLMLGTNDMVQGVSVASYVASMLSIIAKIKAINANVWILVGRMIYQDPSQGTDATTDTYRNGLAAAIRGVSRTVDVSFATMPGTSYADIYHPNATGYATMAATWGQAMAAVLAGKATPSTSVALSGVSATGSGGSVATNSPVTRALTGVIATGSVGSVGAPISVGFDGGVDDFHIGTQISQVVAVAQGACLHVLVTGATAGSDPPFTLTDDRGQFYALLGAVVDVESNSYHYRFAHYALVNAAGGSTTVTASFPTGTVESLGIWVRQIHGAIGVETHAEQTQLSPGTGTDAIAAPSVTPTKQPALVSAFSAGVFTIAPSTAGTGFTGGGAGWGSGSSYLLAEHKRVTSTSAIPATFTHATSGGSRNFASLAAVFMEATTSPAAPSVGNTGTPFIGSPTAGVSAAISGVAGAGTAGSVACPRSNALTGNAGANSTGSVAVGAMAAVTGAAGAASIGSLVGALSASVTGANASGAAGTVTIPAIQLTGASATCAPGSAGAATNVALSGVGCAGASGLVVGGQVITGVAGATAAGSTTTAVVVSAAGIGAISSAGSVAAAPALVGTQGTASAGSVVPSVSVAGTSALGTASVGALLPGLRLVGNVATVAAGTAGTGTFVAIAGASASGAVGSISASTSGNATLAGVGGTAAVGGAAASTSVVAGNGVVGAVSPGSVAAGPAVGLVGVGATSSVASAGVGERQVAVTGNSAASAAGAASPAVSAPLSGVVGTGGVGTIVPLGIPITGAQASAAAGDTGAGVAVVIVGVNGVGAVGAMTGHDNIAKVNSAGLGNSRTRVCRPATGLTKVVKS